MLVVANARITARAGELLHAPARPRPILRREGIVRVAFVFHNANAIRTLLSFEQIFAGAHTIIGAIDSVESAIHRSRPLEGAVL